MREGSIGGGQREEQEQPDLPTEEELEEGIRAVQAAVAAAERRQQGSYNPPLRTGAMSWRKCKRARAQQELYIVSWRHK